jgi:alpha-glucosidase (family GH31 glycosyl hydrolase)
MNKIKNINIFALALFFAQCVGVEQAEQEQLMSALQPDNRSEADKPRIKETAMNELSSKNDGVVEEVYDLVSNAAQDAVNSSEVIKDANLDNEQQASLVAVVKDKVVTEVARSSVIDTAMNELSSKNDGVVEEVDDLASNAAQDIVNSSEVIKDANLSNEQRASLVAAIKDESSSEESNPSMEDVVAQLELPPQQQEQVLQELNTVVEATVPLAEQVQRAVVQAQQAALEAEVAGQVEAAIQSVSNELTPGAMEDFVASMVVNNITAEKVAEPKPACEFDSQDAQQFSTKTSANVGLFTLTRTDKAFYVKHANSQGKKIWEASNDFLAAGETEMHAADQKGSFKITEHNEFYCEKPVITSFVETRSGATLFGTYIDAPAACQDTTFEIRFCQQSAGHLKFQVRTDKEEINLLELRYASNENERIYGLGMQMPHNSTNLKGHEIPVIAQEGGVGRGHAIIGSLINIASPGSGGHQWSSYFPMAHYFTSENRSLFLEDTYVSIFNFKNKNQIKVKLYNGQMTGRILQVNNPKELIERYTEYAGRMPPPPKWVGEGAIIGIQGSTEKAMGIYNDLIAVGAPIAALWLQDWPGQVETNIGTQVKWNWMLDEQHYKGWKNMVSELRKNDTRMLCYINTMFRDIEDPNFADVLINPPGVKNFYREGKAKGYFAKDHHGEVLQLTITNFPTGIVDLTNPEAVDWLKKMIKKEMYENAGCSGHMADFAEALPLEATLHSGVSAAEYHNQYPVDWAKLNREVVEENGLLGDVLVFNRSGFTTSPRYGLMYWEGDQLTTWDKYDGFKNSIKGLLNGGFSGISLNHSDTGGYTSLSQWNLVGYSREKLLLKRWSEMNAFTPIYRSHEGNQPDQNWQVYGRAKGKGSRSTYERNDETMMHFGHFAKVYKALNDYRQTLYHEAYAKGTPVVRHLLIEYPNDPEAHKIDDQFLLGSDILVAPIVEKWPDILSHKSVYFPKGKWVNLWSGKTYGSNSKGKRTRVHAPTGRTETKTKCNKRNWIGWCTSKETTVSYIPGKPAVFIRKDSPYRVSIRDKLNRAGVANKL